MHLISNLFTAVTGIRETPPTVNWPSHVAGAAPARDTHADGALVIHTQAPPDTGCALADLSEASAEFVLSERQPSPIEKLPADALSELADMLRASDLVAPRKASQAMRVAFEPEMKRRAMEEAALAWEAACDLDIAALERREFIGWRPETLMTTPHRLLRLGLHDACESLHSATCSHPSGRWTDHPTHIDALLHAGKHEQALRDIPAGERHEPLNRLMGIFTSRSVQAHLQSGRPDLARQRLVADRSIPPIDARYLQAMICHAEGNADAVECNIAEARRASRQAGHPDGGSELSILTHAFLGDWKSMLAEMRVRHVESDRTAVARSPLATALLQEPSWIEARKRVAARAAPIGAAFIPPTHEQIDEALTLIDSAARAVQAQHFADEGFWALAA